MSLEDLVQRARNTIAKAALSITLAVTPAYSGCSDIAVPPYSCSIGANLIVVDYISLPVMKNPYAYPEVCWNEDSLWFTEVPPPMSDAKGNNIISQLTPTGQVTSSFHFPGYLPASLVYDGEFLWVADVMASEMYKLTTQGKVVESFDFGNPGNVSSSGVPVDMLGDLAWDGEHLWNLDYVNHKMQKLTRSGEIVDSYESPGFSSGGITSDGECLYFGGYYSIIAFNKNGELLGVMASPFDYALDLTFDGKYFWQIAHDGENYKLFKLDKE